MPFTVCPSTVGCLIGSSPTVQAGCLPGCSPFVSPGESTRDGNRMLEGCAHDTFCFPSICMQLQLVFSLESNLRYLNQIDLEQIPRSLDSRI
ncbi:hypothetical protein BDW75DRAFT_215298, partial [Aspergillus navahoensis]